MNLFWQANWGQFYDFFAQGSPSLAIQVLIFNTIFFILWIVRRLRGAPAMRRESSIALQSILIAANFIILFHKDVLVHLG